MESKEELLKITGEILREKRLDSGLSQEKLALECGLDRTFISLLERGKRQPSIMTLFLIAERVGSSPSEIIAQIESRTK
ncbi:MAG: helix-turn-helix transcriptional regulator [Candidatus Marinimicrobia bacterium]|jgi:transcriptional regulator with XRE-family HTH domain|nr:helix-turn-helix transcriptional regulator [Candidatus Neomarinimicrobiota bacterium]MBT4946431.1 helix-turn-helix transcriptional regulator [Candidatus Neomarinimicrobiota bacterium]